LQQYELFLWLNTYMSRKYRPSATFDGPVLLVRSRGSDAVADLGWSALVRGPITAVDVPSDHSNLLRAPAVDRVAASIAAALDS
jgi:thioesterase domain-containing protein